MAEKSCDTNKNKHVLSHIALCGGDLGTASQINSVSGTRMTLYLRLGRSYSSVKADQDGGFASKMAASPGWPVGAGGSLRSLWCGPPH